MRKTRSNARNEFEKTKKIGRPKKEVSITEYLRAYLVANPAQLHMIARAWLDSIKRGNSQALQELLNRFEGKVIEKHEVENKQSITLVFQPVTRAGVLDEVGGQVVEGKFKELEGGTEIQE
jgi:hypothetical protein